MEQASCNACPMISRSGVELQRELNIPRILRAVDQTHIAGRNVGRGSIQVHVVEGVDEIRSELQFHRFLYSKVLLEAEIDIGVAGPADRTLGRTVAELAYTRGRVGRGVEPLVSGKRTRSCVKSVLATEDMILSVAIRTQPARTGPRRIGAKVVQSQWISRMEIDDGVKRPPTSNLVYCARRAVEKPLAMAEGQFVVCISGEGMSLIEVAGCPVSVRVVQVLIIGVCRSGLGVAPGSVITAIVSHAL